MGLPFLGRILDLLVDDGLGGFHAIYFLTFSHIHIYLASLIVTNLARREFTLSFS